VDADAAQQLASALATMHGFSTADAEDIAADITAAAQRHASPLSPTAAASTPRSTASDGAHAAGADTRSDISVDDISPSAGIACAAEDTQSAGDHHSKVHESNEVGGSPTAAADIESGGDCDAADDEQLRTS
jgi:hypothetical protein